MVSTCCGVLDLCAFNRLHISRADRNSGSLMTEFLDENGWAEQRNDNEDLLVLYGICKNFEALVVRCAPRF